MRRASVSEKNRNQGEGDRESAKRYNEATQKFVKSGRVDKAARDATHMTDEERRAAEQAEQAGKRRAKELDPEEKRDFSKGKK
jgi:hypothetical protein